MKMGNSPNRWCGIKGIEKILDFFEANGTWFIVREAEDAMRLEKWLKNAEAPFTFSESFNILLQLLDILTELKKTIARLLRPSFTITRKDMDAVESKLF